ncbi:MIT domain-containing protein 1-like [Planococcus citri]|uniref:MIT domain-containing protein 1-like n=1 Tax=Planococcus citri TaxID=170843 RepID=UPI0031F904D7
MTTEHQIAGNILTKAVTLDGKKRFTEALICYQEGLHILMGVLQNETNPEAKVKYRARISEYMSRAEKIKEYVETEKDKDSYHEQIIIENDSSGHSYATVFGRFLDSSVNEIEIDDPYVRIFHQFQNLVKFYELAVKSCSNLKSITLTTIANGNEQDQWFDQMKVELTRFKVKMNVTYSPTLHDREIRLDNGWIIKIGRGLDYFKAPASKVAVGTFDMDLRKCHETTVDIFHKKTIRKRYG